MTNEEKCVEKLNRLGLSVSFAESCTGGLVAQRLTSVSGASAVFEMGAVTYSDRIKHELLGVRTETLESFTAVSEQTVIEMARGVMRVSGSDIAASVSGIAGPSSDASGAPVGLIWICVCDRETVKTRKLMNNFDGDVRSKNRQAAADAVFEMLSDILTKYGSDKDE